MFCAVWFDHFGGHLKELWICVIHQPPYRDSDEFTAFPDDVSAEYDGNHWVEPQHVEEVGCVESCNGPGAGPNVCHDVTSICFDNK